MQHDSRYLLKFPADLKARAGADAQRRGVSLAKYIRDALEFVLELGKRKGYTSDHAGRSPVQTTPGRVGPVLPGPPPPPTQSAPPSAGE